MSHYRWATLGCGVIAKELAASMAGMGRTLDGVANRTQEHAVAYAKAYGVKKVYGSYDELFDDPDIDVIYISTPHNTHYEFMKKALAAHKNLLVEKSIALNSQQLDEAIELAKANHVVLAEAQTIYHMPVYQELLKLLKSNELGPLKLIQMNFGSYKEYNMANRFFNPKLAGGALLDIGVYALSFSRLFLASKPDVIQSQVVFAPSGVDESEVVLLKNKEGQMVTLTISLHAKQPKRGLLVFEKGYVEVMDYPRADSYSIYRSDTGVTQTVAHVGNTRDALAYEVSDMEAAIDGNPSIMRLNDTKDVMDIMTQLRKDWNFRYPEEK